MPPLRHFKEHAQRQKLNDEVHSRPPANVPKALMCSHLAFVTGENGHEDEKVALKALAHQFGATIPNHFGNHLALNLGRIQLVWERHTEFSTYTLYEHLEAIDGDLEVRFAHAPMTMIPDHWRRDVNSELLVAINLMVRPGSIDEVSKQAQSVFGTNTLVGGKQSGGGAAAWTDLQLDPTGCTRMLIANENLKPGRTGRLVQRLLEIETYRMMALMAFPLARAISPEISEMEEELATIAGETTNITSLEDEQEQLQQLTALAARVETMTARTDFRFSASRAYHEIVRQRLSDLDETKLSGIQQLATFMERRLGPAMRTCTAVATRIDTLSEHIARASSLLRTRVEIAVQEQNQSLLASMESRVRMQVRLQETVEGLSAVAISYYLLGIVNYTLKAAEKLGSPIDPTLATGLAAPIVIGTVYWAVRQVRKRLTKSR
ncbi:MAG: DUF3422 domain-containing protein [Parvibaculum sp.]